MGFRNLPPRWEVGQRDDVLMYYTLFHTTTINHYFLFHGETVTYNRGNPPPLFFPMHPCHDPHPHMHCITSTRTDTHTHTRARAHARTHMHPHHNPTTPPSPPLTRGLPLPMSHRLNVSLQSFLCVPCQASHYSLAPDQRNASRTALHAPCYPCPYGADCAQGGAQIRAKAGFWHAKQACSPPRCSPVLWHFRLQLPSLLSSTGVLNGGPFRVPEDVWAGVWVLAGELLRGSAQVRNFFCAS